MGKKKKKKQSLPALTLSGPPCTNSTFLSFKTLHKGKSYEFNINGGNFKKSAFCDLSSNNV